MKLFIAATPYNLFNYINLKINFFPNEDIDIVISNFDSRNEQYYKNVKELKLFKNVYFVEQKGFDYNRLVPNKIKRFIRKVFCELKNRYLYNSYFKKYCSEMDYNKKYDEIYTDAFGFMPRFIFNHYHSNNKNIKVYKVDCGVECYYDNILSRKNKFMCNRIQKKLCGYYLYSKELANVGGYDVIELPKVNVKDKKFVDLINKIFEYKDEKIKLKQDKFLFLDQCLDDLPEVDSIEQDIVDVLKETAKDNFCVKLHPRTSENNERYKDVEKVKTSSTFEILCLNKPELFNTKIITPFSTAAVLPKLLFDEEPQIICLTKLFTQKHAEAELMTEFFKKVKDTYKDPNKVVIIENLDDFKVKLQERISK